MILEPKTINCETACDMMFDYIDGTLSEADISLLQRHLDECEACRKELAERREMLALVKLSRYNPPSELKASVMEKIEKTPQKSNIFAAKRRILPWAGTVAAACAAVVILVAGRGYFSSDSLLDAKKDNAEVIQYSQTDEAVDEKFASGVLDASYEMKNIFDTEDEDDGEIRYVETTIGSLDALTPGFFDHDMYANDVASPSQTLAEPAEKSELDVFYSKIQVHDVPVILVDEDDVNDAYLTGEPEILIVDGQTFLRYTVTSEAEPIFDAIVNDLEENNAVFKTASPKTLAEGNTVELLVLTDSEN